ncbi:MAG: TPR end-of-group domain-containing protein [Promethearchaeota archaeon]
MDALKRAVALDNTCATEARDNPDFRALYDDPRFLEIVGGA